jgi:hypothetical protein
LAALGVTHLTSSGDGGPQKGESGHSQVITPQEQFVPHDNPRPANPHHSKSAEHEQKPAQTVDVIPRDLEKLGVDPSVVNSIDRLVVEGPQVKAAFETYYNQVINSPFAKLRFDDGRTVAQVLDSLKGADVNKLRKYFYATVNQADAQLNYFLNPYGTAIEDSNSNIWLIQNVLPDGTSSLAMEANINQKELVLNDNAPGVFLDKSFASAKKLVDSIGFNTTNHTSSKDGNIVFTDDGNKVAYFDGHLEYDT